MQGLHPAAVFSGPELRKQPLGSRMWEVAVHLHVGWQLLMPLVTLRGTLAEPSPPVTFPPSLGFSGLWVTVERALPPFKVRLSEGVEKNTVLFISSPFANVN